MRRSFRHHRCHYVRSGQSSNSKSVLDCGAAEPYIPSVRHRRATGVREFAVKRGVYSSGSSGMLCASIQLGCFYPMRESACCSESFCTRGSVRTGRLPVFGYVCMAPSHRESSLSSAWSSSFDSKPGALSQDVPRECPSRMNSTTACTGPGCASASC